MLKAVVAIAVLFSLGCHAGHRTHRASPSEQVKRPSPDIRSGSGLVPVSLYYCVGREQSVDIDTYGIVTLSVLGDLQFAKISLDDLSRLQDLLTSGSYKEGLRGLTRARAPFMCYGDPYAVLTNQPAQGSFMIDLSHFTSLPRGIRDLLAVIDSIGAASFGKGYQAVIPELPGATFNGCMNLTAAPVTARARARSAPGASAGYAVR